MGFFVTLWWLVVGHALADFVLQTDTMAKGKNRHNHTTPPPGARMQPTWFYWLTSHALIHGGMVALVTGHVWLGVAEAICHWCCDFGKCENWYGIHEDQSFHLFCKLLWAIV